MSDLTISFTQEIKEHLTSNRFLPNDFIIETKNQHNYVTLKINYKYIPSYIFNAIIYKHEEKFDLEYEPGKITKLTKRKGVDEQDFFYTIEEWLENIYKELSKMPIARQFKEQEELLKSFQEKIQNMEDGDEFFTKDEGNELRERLDNLEASLMEAIRERDESENKQKTEIRELHNEIETLKTHLELLSRKNWFLSFSTRIYNWYNTNPLLAKRLVGFAREMLPESAKEVIPPEALNQLLLPQSEEKD